MIVTKGVHELIYRKIDKLLQKIIFWEAFHYQYFIGRK